MNLFEKIANKMYFWWPGICTLTIDLHFRSFFKETKVFPKIYAVFYYVIITASVPLQHYTTSNWKFKYIIDEVNNLK